MAELIACPTCTAKNRVPAAATGTPRCGRCRTPLPWITDAGDDTFAEVADAANVPVLVDLWAPWCGPCHMVSPALEQLARDYAGRIKLVKVDVDQSPRTAARFEVRGIPALVVLHRGRILTRRQGAAPLADLRAWLDQTLHAAANAGRRGPAASPSG